MQKSYISHEALGVCYVEAIGSTKGVFSNGQKPGVSEKRSSYFISWQFNFRAGEFGINVGFSKTTLGRKATIIR